MTNYMHLEPCLHRQFGIVYVLYNGKLFHKLVENKIFVEKTFVDCLLVLPKHATSPNFAETTFTNSHKLLKFVKVFSLKSFPLYSSYNSHLPDTAALFTKVYWPHTCRQWSDEREYLNLNFAYECN